MNILPRNPSRRHVASRTAPRLDLLARRVAESMDGRPILEAGLHGRLNALGVIEVDADDCRARGYFRLGPWVNGERGAIVYRTSADGRRADMVAEVDAPRGITAPFIRSIVDVVARRMATIAELEADGVDDPIRGLDSHLLAADVPPCDCNGGADSGGPCRCGDDDATGPAEEESAEAGYDAAFGAFLDGPGTPIGRKRLGR